MKTESRRRLNRRLWRAFILQVALISASAIVGVYLAEFAIRELLIVSALEREAEYFWARENIDRETPAPNTNTLIGYVFEADQTAQFPEEFQNLNTGINELTTPVGDSVVHVSEVRGKRLFLVFDANNVRELATYFGLVPLALLLIVLYTSAWVAYLISRRAVSPLIKLARDVRDLDLNAAETMVFTSGDELQSADDEVLALSQALEQLGERVNKFVERERIFTREASHELRSPLTVIRIASDMLLARDVLSEHDRNTLLKVQRAANDMEELTQAFLLLAREGESGLQKEALSVNDIAIAEIARCDMVYAEKGLELSLEEHDVISVNSSPKVVAIVIGNLLRNACAYTDRGHVKVEIRERTVRIEDSGVGISHDEIEAVFTPYYRAPNTRESGHGIGLSLVKRMTDRFGWVVSIVSRPGTGTVVEVTFPDAEVTPKSSSDLGEIAITT